MKLDRNLNSDGLGKYALLKLRVLAKHERASGSPFHRWDADIEDALVTLEDAGILDWGRANSESEFMLIRPKDRYAQAALRAYAQAAEGDDPEWADEVRRMSDRAGPDSPYCKTPD